MASQLFMDGGHWRLALGVVHQGNRGDLVKSSIAPAAARGAVKLLSDIRADEARICKYVQRLRDLRAKREAMAERIGASNSLCACVPLSRIFVHQRGLSTLNEIIMSVQTRLRDLQGTAHIDYVNDE